MLGKEPALVVGLTLRLMLGRALLQQEPLPLGRNVEQQPTLGGVLVGELGLLPLGRIVRQQPSLVGGALGELALRPPLSGVLLGQEPKSWGGVCDLSKPPSLQASS